MGMNIRPSEQLDNAIFSALDKRIQCTYRLECTISNAETGFELEVYYFTGMGINQSFTENYTDLISVSIELRPSDFLTVLTNYNNLNCTIILTTVDAHTFYDVDDLDPIIFTGRVIINNPQDIMKKYNFRQLIEEEDDPNSEESKKAVKLPLSFQMMRQETYDLKRKEVNAMFTDTTLDKVMSFVADQFGITATNMKLPDNMDKIKNLVIPPGQDLSSVFHYLQERFGVFGNGMSAYISDKILHIYPPNDTEAKDYKTTMHVIKAPANYIPGEQGYHTVENGELIVVSTGGGDIANMTEAGVEQAGNTQVSVQSDRMIDFTTTMKEDGEVKMNENTQTLSLDTKNQAQENAINARYSGETVNSFNQLSNMGQYDCIMATLNWVSARPMLLNPGQKLTLHYDDENGVYTTASGVLEGISFTSSKLDKYIGQPFYIFGSQIVARLKSNKRD